MIELVLDHVVASDDALLKLRGHPQLSDGSPLTRLARMLELSEPETRAALRKSPLPLLHGLGEADPVAHVLYACCLGEAMLDEVLEFARSRKTFGKALLSHQAVALRVSAVYLGLLQLEQALDDFRLWAACGSDAQRGSRRLLHASDLVLDILRNAAQVMAGHGYVDNEAFSEMHEAALQTARILVNQGHAWLNS